MKHGVVKEYYELLRLVVDHGAYAVLVVDSANAIQITNPAADRLFGRTAEELIGSLFPFPVDTRRLAQGETVEAADGSWRAQMHVQRAAVAGKKLFVVSLRDVAEPSSPVGVFRESMLVDSLTGLLNEQGFRVLAEQQFKLARRTGRGLVLLVADLDGMGEINKSVDRESGDLALKEAGVLVRHTFRDSDLVARIRDDEFALLAIDTREDCSGILVARLRDSFWERNAHTGQVYALSVSTGVVRFDPEAGSTVDHLLQEARAQLNEHRRHKGLSPQREATG